MTAGHRIRWQRLFRHHSARTLVVPLDHSLTSGPLPASGPLAGEPGLDALVARIVSGGADAIVVHKGSLRQVDPSRFVDTALILHLSGGTDLAPDPDAKYLVATVDEAVSRGADAVSVHVNLGSNGESRQLADLARVAEACDRWGMPLLAMVYPRGPRIANPREPELIAHAVTVAADLGADLVKTVNPGSIEVLAEITRLSPIPVLVAGGAFDPHECTTLARVRDAIRAGASGVAIGRAIFQSCDPAATTRKIAELVHGCTGIEPSPKPAQRREFTYELAQGHDFTQGGHHEAVLVGHPPRG